MKRILDDCGRFPYSQRLQAQEETRPAEKQPGRRNHSTQKVFNEAVETMSASTANMMEIGCVRVSSRSVHGPPVQTSRVRFFSTLWKYYAKLETRETRIEIGTAKNFQHV
jgi:hypothetical protein